MLLSCCRAPIHARLALLCSSFAGHRPPTSNLRRSFPGRLVRPCPQTPHCASSLAHLTLKQTPPTPHPTALPLPQPNPDLCRSSSTVVQSPPLLSRPSDHATICPPSGQSVSLVPIELDFRSNLCYVRSCPLVPGNMLARTHSGVSTGNVLRAFDAVCKKRSNAVSYRTFVPWMLWLRLS